MTPPHLAARMRAHIVRLPADGARLRTPSLVLGMLWYRLKDLL